MLYLIMLYYLIILMKDVVFLIIMTHGGELSRFTGDKEQEVVMLNDRQTDITITHTNTPTENTIRNTK